MKSVILSLMLVCVLTVNGFTQSINLNVSYSRIEKSKDVKEQLETFDITNYDAAFSVKYTGEVFPRELNEEKRCVIDDESVRKIRESISENHITQNIYRDEHHFEGDVHSQYISILIALTIDGESYTITLEGDSSRVMNIKDYRNAIEFIKDLRKIIKDCT